MGKKQDRRRRRRTARGLKKPPLDAKALAEFEALLDQQAAELPGKSARDVAALQETLRGKWALPLLAGVALELYLDRLAQKDPSSLKAEYLTWLLLIRNEPITTNGIVPSDDDMVAIQAALTQVMDDVQLRILLSGRKSGEGRPIDKLAQHASLDGLFTRARTYRPHHRNLLRATFARSAGDLSRLIGLTIDEALTLEDALVTLVLERLREILKDAGRRSSRQVLDLFVVSPTDLQQASGCAEDAAAAFLALLSLAPGQEAIGDNMPSLFEPLELAPLVRLDNGSVVAHLFDKVLWALQPALEKVLAGDGRMRPYEATRAAYLETESVELIKSASQAARGWTSLTYEFDDGAGLRGFELDGLVLVDSIAFLVEAKAGRFSLPARRGAPGRVAEDFKKLVAHPGLQVARAAKFLSSAPEVHFRAADEEIVVRPGHLTRIIPVVTTLDPIPAVTIRRTLRDAGILPADLSPWIVCESDLRAIVSVVEGIGELVHYLQRRIGMESSTVSGQDELDLFGHYLQYGLYLEEEQAKYHSTVLGAGFATALDVFFAAVESGKDVEPPRQPMPPVMRELIQHLERSAPDGFIEAIVALLEPGGAARDAFGHALPELRRRAEKTGRASFRGGFSDTAVAVVITRGPALQREIDEFTIAAKYDAKANRGVGIMQSASDPNSLAVSLLSEPWQVRADYSLITQRIFAGMKRVTQTNVPKR